jgi:hypothetical protein
VSIGVVTQPASKGVYLKIRIQSEDIEFGFTSSCSALSFSVNVSCARLESGSAELSLVRLVFWWQNDELATSAGFE